MDMNLIKKYLPKDLWEYASKFEIPDMFLEDDSGLIELILRSKSIDTDEEKQNWFNLLLIMTDEQLEKLKDILKKEQEKLKEIEEKYEKKKQEIKKKYLLKWQKMWYIKQISKIKETEEKIKTEEEKEAEKLLENI